MNNTSQPSLKVLQICPGQVENAISMSFVRQQASDLRDIGVDVREVFIEDRTSVKGILRARSIIKSALKEWQPDILHAQYGTATALTAMLCGFSPLVITFRGSDLNPDATSSKLRMGTKILMSQMGALFATRLVAVSVQLQSRLWWRKNNVSIIPSGVNMEKFRPIPMAQARNALGWTHDDPVILFNAGFNHVNKRLDLAESTLARVQQVMPNVRLHVMAGKTPTDEVPLLMNACDMLWLLSDFEGSPNVVKESLACNLPVIAFDVGDVAERLSGQSHCKLIPRDMDTLFASTLECLELRERADSRPSIEPISNRAVAHALLDVYQSALTRLGT